MLASPPLPAIVSQQHTHASNASPSRKQGLGRGGGGGGGDGTEERDSESDDEYDDSDSSGSGSGSEGDGYWSDDHPDGELPGNPFFSAIVRYVGFSLRGCHRKHNLDCAKGPF